MLFLTYLNVQQVKVLVKVQFNQFIFSLAMPASSQQLWVWGTEVKVNRPALVELGSTLPATGADHASFDLPREMLFWFFFMSVSYGPLALRLGSCKLRVVGFTHYFNNVCWQVQWKAALLCSRCGWKWSLHKVLLHYPPMSLRPRRIVRGSEQGRRLECRHMLSLDKASYSFPSVVLSAEGLHLNFCIFVWSDTSGIIRNFCSQPRFCLRQWVWRRDWYRGHCTGIWFWLYTEKTEGRWEMRLGWGGLLVLSASGKWKDLFFPG